MKARWDSAYSSNFKFYIDEVDLDEERKLLSDVEEEEQEEKEEEEKEEEEEEEKKEESIDELKKTKYFLDFSLTKIEPQTTWYIYEEGKEEIEEEKKRKKKKKEEEEEVEWDWVRCQPQTTWYIYEEIEDARTKNDLVSQEAMTSLCL
ncbi:hypothetical protein SK128_010479 [Halocaridina rubra]|uniref:Uncharacterized protein n=1 Tax=Halocaridina rubra TaxID=373956 RepID=A0AAN8XQN6_HALRR